MRCYLSCDCNSALFRPSDDLYSASCCQVTDVKTGAGLFGKQRVALCGKVGGMKDDVCIALQLAVYYSATPQMYA